ncbi:hypothetical protein LCGC14_2220650 [marine sediment metagenome]|uniref:HNH nuclease domain-containing protein n=1 Tax=marine sediment metagenome TaxID=412755 RepID=A0A0F9DB27_9ZZZZ
MPRQYTKRPSEERFWSKVVFPEDSDCWLWAASINNNGYGEFWAGDKYVKAHRWAYEYLIGPIPAGLTIDHLCRNRPCVNPAHMEAVTHAENVRRGARAAAFRNKTHCPRGHPYSEENTYITASGWRRCRACNRDYMRRLASRATGIPLAVIQGRDGEREA